MLTWWVNLSRRAPVSRSVPKVSVHSSNGRLLVIALIVTGGMLYTIGVAFFLFGRLPFHYTIWHLFVLAASMVFYAAVMVHLVQTA